MALTVWTGLSLTYVTRCFAERIVTLDELAAMSDEALLNRVARANLFCRIAPAQKLRGLLTPKRSGQSVGFLGDGINDAPALHTRRRRHLCR